MPQPAAPVPPPPAGGPPPFPATAPLYPGAAPQYGGYYVQQAPPFVDIVIRGTKEPLLVELYHPAARPLFDAPIARCQVPCRAHVPVGRYKLYVHEAPGTVSGSRVVDIAQPATLTVEPSTRGARAGGLVIGITGITAAAVGFVMLLSNYCLGDCSDENDGRRTSGALVMLLGLAATPAGWIMYAKSFKPGVTQSGPQLALSPALIPSRGSASVDNLPGFVFSGRF